ncbi:MAG: mechanosensitive ion channel family protein [Deltaproteobacteria bacterium]|nr:MAG: mechanosensitive ion channel family protein [Deltaproteobacteria bacterium]
MENIDLNQINALVVPIAKAIVLAVIIFVIGNSLAKTLHRVTQSRLEGRGVDAALSRFLGQMVRYGVFAATVISALGVLGIETTSFVAILGSAGIAVGLALQGSLANFAAGVMILFFRPFTLGDVITAGGHTGKVVDIGLFATTLHTPDNMKIIVPNGAITGGSITNITTLGTRRISVDVGVAYGADLQQVQQVLQKAAERCTRALKDPAPAVAFVNLGASSLDFTVFAWCRSADWLDLMHELRCNVYDDLNNAGIEIPFNQIVVHQAADAA